MESQNLHSAKANKGIHLRRIFNNKTLFATVPDTICYSTRTKHYSRYSTMTNFSKNAATFGKSKMQLSKADNQLSRQEASPFSNINAQLCTQGLYKAEQIKAEEQNKNERTNYRVNSRILFVLKFSYSPSLLSQIVFSANFSFQSLRQISLL